MRRLLIALLLLLPAAANAAMTGAVCHVAGRTTNGTVDCADTDAGAISFFIGFSSYATAVDTNTANGRQTIGLVGNDGGAITQAVTGRWGKDNQASVDVQCSRNDDSKAFITQTEASTCASVDVADASAIVTGGITYNYTTASGRAQLLEGLGITCATCESAVLKFALPSGSSAAVAVPHTLSTTPTFLVYIGQQSGADSGTTAGARTSIGFYDGTRMVGYFHGATAAGVGNAAGSFWDSKWGVTGNYDYVTPSMDVTNVTLTPTAVAGNTATVYVLAVYGPDVHAYVGTATSPVTSGAGQTPITGLPYTPTALVFIPTRMTSKNTTSNTDNGGFIGIGAVATTGGITQAAVASSIDDGASTTDSNSYTTEANSLLITETDGTVKTVCSVTGVTTTITMNCGTASGTAMHFGYLSLQQDAGDDAPAAYTWDDVTGQEWNTVIESNEEQITGLTIGAAITVSGDAGCEWDSRTAAGSYDGFSAGSGTINNTDYVKLHVDSASVDATAKTCASTIGTGGSATDTFSATTGDSSPTAFTNGFTDVTNQALSTVVTSNCLTIAGINIGANVTCTQTCNVNGGAYSAAPGVINSGEQFCARLTTSGSPSTAVTNVVTVGGQSDTFSATTAAGGVDSSIQRLVYDTFTGTDGTSITAHTPDVGGAWTLDNGTATIQSNKLSMGASAVAVIAVGTADMVVDSTWTSGSTDVGSVASRYTDTLHYYRCRINKTVTPAQVLLQLVNTSITALAGTTATVTNADHRLTIFSIGTQHGCLLDGVLQVAASDSTLSDTKAALVNGPTVQVYDTFSVMHGYKVVMDDTLAIADDPKGLFQGDTVGNNSVFWMSPNNVFAHHVPTWYQGGSQYYDVEASYVGTDDAGWERYNSTTNAVDTGTVTITTTGTSTVAPVLGAIPAQTCTVNTDPGPIALTTYLTTVGEPAPTWSITAGSLATGRILSTGGAITGPCTAAGSFSATIQALNATGSSSQTLAYTASDPVVGGTGPACTDIPNLYALVGDVINIDLNDYCDDVDVYSSGTLAGGLSRSGSVISGTLTTAQHIITQLSGSNSEGTSNIRWMQDVRNAGSDCSLIHIAKNRRIFGHNECIPR